jgi:hypothetical protein
MAYPRILCKLFKVKPIGPSIMKNSNILQAFILQLIFLITIVMLAIIKIWVLQASKKY